MIETIPLKELVSISKGKKPTEVIDEERDGFLPYLTAAQLLNGDVKKWAKGGIDAATSNVLISWDGTVGNVGWGITGIVGSTIGIISPNLERVDVDFLGRFLSTKKRLLNDTATGATIKHIRRSVLENLQFPSIPLSEQRRIAAILDKADEIKQSSTKFSQSKNSVIKSVFLEMFGDPEFPNCNVVELNEVISPEKYSMRRGPFGGSLKKEIFVDSGYLVYEQRHAIHNDFEFARYYITEEKYRELESFCVNPGDLIISCSGVTLGRIAEIPAEAAPGVINQALLKISLDKSKICNQYFIHLFRNERIQHRIFGISRGSGIPNFPPLKQIKTIQIPLPPLEKQLRFSTIVEHINRIFETDSENRISELMNSVSVDVLTNQ